MAEEANSSSWVDEQDLVPDENAPLIQQLGKIKIAKYEAPPTSQVMPESISDHIGSASRKIREDVIARTWKKLPESYDPAVPNETDYEREQGNKVFENENRPKPEGKKVEKKSFSELVHAPMKGQAGVVPLNEFALAVKAETQKKKLKKFADAVAAER